VNTPAKRLSIRVVAGTTSIASQMGTLLFTIAAQMFSTLTKVPVSQRRLGVTYAARMMFAQVHQI